MAAAALAPQLARWALAKKASQHLIEPETLTLAIQHVEECLSAADFLGGIASRAKFTADAEVMLATIQHEYRDMAKAGTILLQRTVITRRFCHHSSRQAAWKPDDIYRRIIPEMERRGVAKLIRRSPSELYAFKAGE